MRLPSPGFRKRLREVFAVWQRLRCLIGRRWCCSEQHPTHRDGGIMGRVIASGLWTLLFFAGSAIADLKVMVGVHPSDRESMVISVLDMQQMLSKVSGQPVYAVKSQKPGDVMRT